MSTVKISALPTAVSIDATADYLPIVTASGGPVTQKINRNTLLGITGSPVGTSDTQILTNKTLGNTNTVTVKDTLFTLQDDGDTTKQARFQLSGITTATTRTYTFPNLTDTLVSLTATQSLTNKTLTSPIISGGSLDNTTITVDSISGHTTPTIVTVGGVQMNNGTIGTAGAVVTASIADSAVTPAKLLANTGTGWSWTSWTPTWTNLTVGNGTLTAKYIQTGKTVVMRLVLVLGTTTSISGSISFSLPVSMVQWGQSGTASFPIGQARYEDTGGGGYIGGLENGTSQTTVFLVVYNAAGTYAQPAGVTATVPFTFGTGDTIACYGVYEAA